MDHHREKKYQVGGDDHLQETGVIQVQALIELDRKEFENLYFNDLTSPSMISGLDYKLL